MELNIKVDRLTMYQHICSEFEKKEELDCRDKAFVCRIVELCQKKSKLNEEVEKKKLPRRKNQPQRKSVDDHQKPVVKNYKRKPKSDYLVQKRNPNLL